MTNVNTIVSDEIAEPNTYQEAMNSDQRDQWKEAMNLDLSSMKSSNAWTLTDLPPGERNLDYRWIFEIKRNPDGTVKKYRARIVA